MHGSGEEKLTRIRENLVIVSKQAELMHPTELVLSDEFQSATVTIDEILADPRGHGRLRLLMGQKILPALLLKPGDNEVMAFEATSLRPSRTYALSRRIDIPSNTFLSDPVNEPLYGKKWFFTPTIMSDALATGGDVYLNPVPSSNT